MRRGAVLHAGAADHRHRTGYDHITSGIGAAMIAGSACHAVLCDAEGASGPAQPRRRQGRRHHYKIAAHASISARVTRAQLRDDALSRARFDFRLETRFHSDSIRNRPAASTTKRCPRTPTRSRISARCAGPKFCSMKITQERPRLCATLNDPTGVGMSVSGVIERDGADVAKFKEMGGKCIWMREVRKQSGV